MAAASETALIARLKVWMREQANSFSDAEYTEALDTAMSDPLVFKTVRNSTTTTTANTSSYAVPTGVTNVEDVLIDFGGDSKPTAISGWEVIDGTIYFDRTAPAIPAGLTMTVIGRYKFAKTDNMPDDLQEYVLHLGAITLYRILKANLVTTFLTNDTSIADIMTAMADHEQRATALRRTITSRRAVTL